MRRTDIVNERLYCEYAALIRALEDPGATVEFRAGSSGPEGYPFHHIPLATTVIREWQVVPLNEPEPPQPEKKGVGAGLIAIEPDERIWLCETVGPVGSTRHTFPKTGNDSWPTLQQNALHAALGKAGLICHISDWLGDYTRSTRVVRYYVGARTGGAPWAAGGNTVAVKLVPLHDAERLLDKKIDKKILHDVIAWLERDKQKKANLAALAELDLQQMAFNPSLSSVWDSWRMLETFSHRCEKQAALAAEREDWTVGLHHEREHMESQAQCLAWRDLYLQLLRGHVEACHCTSPYTEGEARVAVNHAEKALAEATNEVDRAMASDALKISLLYATAASLGPTPRK